MPLKTSGISQTPYTMQCTHPESHLPTDEPQQPTPESTLPNTVPQTKQFNKHGAISLKLLHYRCSCRLNRKTQIAPLARRKQLSHIYCILTTVKMWMFSSKILGICVTIKYQGKNNFPTHPNKRQIFWSKIYPPEKRTQISTYFNHAVDAITSPWDLAGWKGLCQLSILQSTHEDIVLADQGKSKQVP